MTGDPLRKDLPRNQHGVALAWKYGYKMSSGHMRTDGDKAWSWDLVIGVTVRGDKTAIDYRGEVSGSTSRHVGEVVGVADVVTDPGEVSHG